MTKILVRFVKQVPNDIMTVYKLRYKSPNIPFRQIAGMRDKLIHDYFGVDYEIIWKTIKDKLPQFAKDIENLINNCK